MQLTLSWSAKILLSTLISVINAAARLLAKDLPQLLHLRFYALYPSLTYNCTDHIKFKQVIIASAESLNFLNHLLPLYNACFAPLIVRMFTSPDQGTALTQRRSLTVTGPSLCNALTPSICASPLTPSLGSMFESCLTIFSRDSNTRSNSEYKYKKRYRNVTLNYATRN